MENIQVFTVCARARFYYFHQLQLPLIYSAQASISFLIPLRTSPALTSITNFQQLSYGVQKGAPTSARSTSVDVSTNYHGSFHGSGINSTETTIEVGGSRFSSMQFVVEVGGSILVSMQVSGNFHGSTRKFPLSVEVESYIASINCSFHVYSVERVEFK